MIDLKIKLTADGEKAGTFEIQGTEQEKEALWHIINLAMPDPLGTLAKLDPSQVINPTIKLH
jgi:hypothetical protein